MQVSWSPVDAETCVVVTESGQLLLGVLGKRLVPLQSASQALCATWSQNGCLLAYGFGDQVHVYDLKQGAIRWSTEISSAVLQVMVAFALPQQQHACKVSCHDHTVLASQQHKQTAGADNRLQPPTFLSISGDQLMSPMAMLRLPARHALLLPASQCLHMLIKFWLLLHLALARLFANSNKDMYQRLNRSSIASVVQLIIITTTSAAPLDNIPVPYGQKQPAATTAPKSTSPLPPPPPPPPPQGSWPPNKQGLLNLNARGVPALYTSSA